jgi:hypothetical protein
MAKDLPGSLKRIAVTRLAELDFELDPPVKLPEEVVQRFPGMRKWEEAEADRHRKNERLIREVITALRETRNTGA